MFSCVSWISHSLAAGSVSSSDTFSTRTQTPNQISSSVGAGESSGSPTKYSLSSTSFGFMYRDISIWYFSPLTSR